MRHGCKLFIVMMLGLLFCLPAVGFAKTTLKIGHSGQPGDYGPFIEHFAEQIEKLSNGSIEVKNFAAGSLCKSNECIGMTQRGTLDIAFAATTTASAFVPSISCMSVPYIFSEENVPSFLKSLMHGPVHDYLNTKFNEINLEHVCTIFTGMRVFAFAKKDVQRVEDLKGVKMRSMPSNVDTEALKLLGMQPCAIPSVDCYIALQQGTVDGEPISLSDFMLAKRDEVERYIWATYHNIGPVLGFFNKRRWESLKPEERDIIARAAVIAEEYTLAETEKLTRQGYQYCLDNKVKINSVSPEDREKMIKAIQPLYVQFKDVFDPKLVALVNEALGLRK